MTKTAWERSLSVLAHRVLSERHVFDAPGYFRLFTSNTMNNEPSNPVVSDFTRNLTEEAEAGLLEMPLGRDKEIETILNIVSVEGKSNVLLLGPAGCGKTMLVEGVACKLVELISRNQSPHRSKLILLNLTALNSGAMYVGQFEKRVTDFLNYVRQDPSIIVFIDEIHMVMGFGTASGSNASRDFSQILKPALARGEMCCIGATTTHEYERDIKPDGAFVRRFQTINLNPVDAHTIVEIIRKHALKIKYNYGMEFSDQTIQSVISISESLYPDRYQPDKSIDIIRKVAACIQSTTKEKSSGNRRRTIDAYLDALGHEIKAVERNDSSGLIRAAQDWLGVSASKSSLVDLNIDSLRELLQSGTR